MAVAQNVFYSYVIAVIAQATFGLLSSNLQAVLGLIYCGADQKDYHV